MRPRPVPYALLDRVDKEIDRLEADGIIERVEYASWGTPLVPIVKSDEPIRLCADFKVTLNHDDKYPTPKIEEMDEEGALLQTISTHKGPYKVKRLMFGVKVAPNVFQRFMDQTLQGRYLLFRRHPGPGDDPAARAADIQFSVEYLRYWGIFKQAKFQL
jgi:hypothetical protein